MVCISAQTALGFDISYECGILALKFRGDPSAEAVGKVGLGRIAKIIPTLYDEVQLGLARRGVDFCYNAKCFMSEGIV